MENLFTLKSFHNTGEKLPAQEREIVNIIGAWDLFSFGSRYNLGQSNVSSLQQVVCSLHLLSPIIHVWKGKSEHMRTGSTFLFSVVILCIWRIGVWWGWWDSPLHKEAFKSQGPQSHVEMFSSSGSCLQTIGGIDVHMDSNKVRGASPLLV